MPRGDLTAGMGYHPRVMRGIRWRHASVLLAVLASAQLGHFLTYLARFGGAAGWHEAGGVHSYYVPLAAGLGGALAVVLMSSLVVLAAARSTLMMRPGCRPRSTVRFLDVLVATFASQLAIFLAQELIETLVAGHALSSPVRLLVWGALGQLPAAAIAAALIVWLLTRVEAAWTAYVEGIPTPAIQPAAPAAPPPTRPDADSRLRLGSTFPSAFRRRGPPLAVQT